MDDGECTNNKDIDWDFFVRLLLQYPVITKIINYSFITMSNYSFITMSTVLLSN